MGAKLSASRHGKVPSRGKFVSKVGTTSVVGVEGCSERDDGTTPSCRFASHRPSVTRRQFDEELRKQFPFAENTSDFAAHLSRAAKKCSRKRSTGSNSSASDQVDLAELMRTLAETLTGDDMAKIDWVFGLYDIDEDGVITKNDMLNVVTSVERLSPSPAPSTSATANSPVKSRARCSSVEARVRKVFQDLDEDRDGRVTREQFIEIAKQDVDLLSFQAPDLALMAASPCHGYSEETDGSTATSASREEGPVRLWVDLQAV